MAENDKLFEAKPLPEVAAALASIGPDAEGRYTFDNRQPPLGYVTFRDSWRVADVHPSWLRTLVSGGGLDHYDQEGAPAAIRNPRGTWAVRIDALTAYEAVKRTPGEGTGAGAGYRYEPMVLKSVKRTITACDQYAAEMADPAGTKADLELLAASLKDMWEKGIIGKTDEDEEEEGEKPKKKAKAKPVTAEPAAAEAEDLDFDFDFSEEDAS